MDFSYIVRISVRTTIYSPYKKWLQDHIEGNAARGIKGMMEILHNGRYLFPSVEVFTTDAIGEFHLLTVKYYTDEIGNIDNYIEHYAASMRGEMPEDFHTNTAFNRFIGDGRSVRPLGEVNQDLEQMFIQHEDKAYNLASFEVYR